MKTTVSIVVPCYNQAQYLDQTLQSVLDQTFADWECIIVNDGSPDNTEEVAKKWLQLDPRFKYIYQENAGLSAARNAGIMLAIGEYILPLDSDDYLEETYLEKAVAVISADAKVGAVSCFVSCFVNSGEVVYKYEPKGGSIDDFLYQNNANANSLFRKEIWKSIGGYDIKMKQGYEDWEFWIALTSKGYKIQVIPEFLCNYRKNSGSMLENVRNLHDESVRKYLLLKHQQLYLIDFEKTIDYLQSATYKYKKNEIKRLNSLEFRVGRTILSPIRFIKRLFLFKQN